jgi:lipopolysaccharide export system protein LptA
MAVDLKLMRKLFAAGAVLAVLVAAGFYLRGILKSWRQPAVHPKNLPQDAAQVATGFTYSQSDGGKTIFKISATSVQQSKDLQRVQLQDASIILYGKEGDRSDRIFGDDFQINKGTGDVIAKGEVHIDLETNSPVGGMPDGVSMPDKSTVHLKTRGLVFNQNTGVAQTKELIEFRIPEAGGSAVGAIYDSRSGVLELKSSVQIVTTGRQKANITAQSATVLRVPQRIIMRGAKIEQPPRSITTEQLTVMLRPDNTVERITGAGGVHARGEGPKGFEVNAATGELILDASSQLRSGNLSGGVTLVSRGEQPAEGKADRLLLAFGPKGRLQQARAEDAVEFKQGDPAKSQELHAAAVDLYLREGKLLEKATTSAGPAQIVLSQKDTRSTISAGQFEAKFGEQNRLRSVFGNGNASVVSATPGHPDRVTTSRDITATFNNKGEIASAEQTGDFRYQEGDRKGVAERARYNPADETYDLTGSPRMSSGELALTADDIQLSRKTGGAFAQGNVKTTYNQKAQPNGAMLGSADPVHVTGRTMTASRPGGTARYTDARLWRGPDIVEAPSIVFDHDRRSLQAESSKAGRVASVFVQPNKNGKLTPVNVSADKLTYVDSDRKAVFSGTVVVGIEGGTIDADSVQTILRSRGAQSEVQSASQLDRIVAQGNVRIKQPNREASGSQLLYTGAEEKFVLTGSPASPPSIFDAERGQISGDSLTFFTHDGRVLVGSRESSQSQTQTKVQDASKK